jgi:hypothetical protein
MAMVFSAVAGVVLVVVVVGMSYFKFDSAMPVAGSCSVAIAAVCHTDHGERAAQDLLQWGELYLGLRKRRWDIVRSRVGLSGDLLLDGYTLGEVGHEFGMRNRGSRLVRSFVMVRGYQQPVTCLEIQNTRSSAGTISYTVGIMLKASRSPKKTS